MRWSPSWMRCWVTPQWGGQTAAKGSWQHASTWSCQLHSHSSHPGRSHSHSIHLPGKIYSGKTKTHHPSRPGLFRVGCLHPAVFCCAHCASYYVLRLLPKGLGGVNKMGRPVCMQPLYLPWQKSLPIHFTLSSLSPKGMYPSHHTCTRKAAFV